MKASYYLGNKKFSVKEAEAPTLQAGEVRLDVAYCGICGTDIHIYHGNMDKRVKMPQIIGHEVSATIAELGEGVRGFEVGENVTVRPLNPGEQYPSDNGQTHIGQNLKFIGIDSPGGMQTSWVVPAYTLHKLPENVSLQHGALIEPLAVACHDVRLGRLEAEEQVVVIGGGPIGILIGLVAKMKGAKVIISEVNAYRIKFIQSLGLETIDPRTEDIVEKVRVSTDNAMADIVFEVSGTESGVQVMTELLKARGRVVLVAIHATPKPVDLFRFFWRELQMIGVRVYEPEDFEEAIQIIATQKIPIEKLITQVMSLDNIQQAFESIDNNPEGIKYLIDCRN